MLTLNSKTMGLVLPFHIINYTVHFIKLFP